MPICASYVIACGAEEEQHHRLEFRRLARPAGKTGLVAYVDELVGVEALLNSMGVVIRPAPPA